MKPKDAVARVMLRMRYMAGLSQREAEDLSGLQRTYFSKVENGGAAPQIDSLVKLTELYGQTMEGFGRLLDAEMRGEGGPLPPKPAGKPRGRKSWRVIE
jgi:transcriptional regulator with XRE-family HTH domain